jgi:hypothetical protein
MSTYTRVYPIDDRSYSPGANPSLKGRCTVTAASSDILVSDAIYAAAGTGWVVTIYDGQDSNVIGSYSVNALVAPNSLTLDELDGTAWSAPVGSSGSYDFILFDPAAPTTNDFAPEAIIFDTLPGTGMEVILNSGQYAILDPAVFVINAIYSIGIVKIIDRDGATGYLLGRDGQNGRSYIYK